MGWSRKLLLLVPLWACAPELQLPKGASCKRTTYSGSQLSSTLGSAASGDCVVASPGTYQEALSVPPGVRLASEVGRTVNLEGSTITLAAGASLSGVHVAGVAGIGVLINGHAQLSDVTVDGASGAGIVGWCEEDCRADPGSELENVVVTNSSVGLWVRGAKLKVTGGRISGSLGQSLGQGYGVVASHGASLEMNGTTVDANQELGALIDGDLDTTATLKDVTLKDNLGRGIWAQKLAGTDASPRLTLDTCTLSNNAIAGLGARASSGIRMTGGRIEGTKLAPVQGATPGQTIMVGDGVGLFESTGQVRLDGVTLAQNQRAQALIDSGANGLDLSTVTVTAASGQQGVVVQRTTATVQAPNITVPMAGMELPVSSPQLAVPTR